MRPLPDENDIYELEKYLEENNLDGLLHLSRIVTELNERRVSDGEEPYNTEKLRRHDTFASRVRTFLRLCPHRKREAADALEVAQSTLDRWAAGKTSPHPKLYDTVEKTLFSIEANAWENDEIDTTGWYEVK